MTGHNHPGTMLHAGCPACSERVTRWFRIGIVALGRPTRSAAITEPARQGRP